MISVTLLRESQTTLVATVPKRWFTLCLPKTNRGTLAISFSDGGDFISYAHRLFPLCMCLCMRGRERWWVVRWLVPGMFHDVLPYREGPQPGRLRLTARPCRSSCSHSLSPSPSVLSWKICQPVFISKEDLHYHLHLCRLGSIRSEVKDQGQTQLHATGGKILLKDTHSSAHDWQGEVWSAGLKQLKGSMQPSCSQHDFLDLRAFVWCLMCDRKFKQRASLQKHAVIK